MPEKSILPTREAVIEGVTVEVVAFELTKDTISQHHGVTKNEALNAYLTVGPLHQKADPGPLWTPVVEVVAFELTENTLS